MRKRSLTLLEVIIALVLAAILLSTLFTFYRNLFVTRSQIQTSKNISLQRVLTQERLTQIFGKLLSEVEEEKGVIFYTAGHNKALSLILYFAYDNGIDPDPQYCGTVKALLYLSLEKKLTLLTLPAREEILLEDVDSLFFAFFDIKEKSWQNSWVSEAGKLPAMIKLLINEDPIVFFLPDASKKITINTKT